ncbi:MAG: sensor histidine kinase [Rubrivivax sp.]|nr:sensor histidine kinase [Rubrivivax sp.]
MLAQQQRFAADAAHRLRTLLAVLQTQLQSGLGGACDLAAATRVTVQADPTASGGITWTCWDQGPGIAPALRERVFEPFAQTGMTPPEGEPQGHGLGLSICRAIVLSCGGCIRLEDHADGRSGAPGLRVTVDLPQAAV